MEGATIENSSAPNKEKDPPQKSNKSIQGGIQVSSRQRGNPILKSIRSVPWEFQDGMVPARRTEWSQDAPLPIYVFKSTSIQSSIYFWQVGSM